MTKTAELPKTEGVVEPVLNSLPPQSMDAPISTAQLLELLSKMNAESAKTLAAAIVEAQKPYEDPKKAANEEMFRQNTRRQMEQQDADKKASQAHCPHIAGCNSLSEFRDHMNRTSIIWHKTDATEVVGICTNCQRWFRSNEPDYSEWRSKPCFNRPSASGNREYMDPRAAIERARS